MRDPESVFFGRVQELMASGDMTGMNRPVGRITIGYNYLKRFFSERPGPWRSVLFTQGRQPEMPGVKTIDINRSIGQDAATCTIMIANEPYLHGRRFPPEGIDTGISRPGYLSPDRGRDAEVHMQSAYDRFLPAGVPATEAFPTDWGYPLPWGWGETESTEVDRIRVYDGGTGPEAAPDSVWLRSALLPNRLVRTFQGYGSDNFDPNGEPYEYGDPEYVPPFDDTKLVQTGIWLIDKLTFGNDGWITIECRDLAKLLLEQVIYPPMLPLERFPLVYCPLRNWTTETTVPGETVTGLAEIGDYYSSGNDPWFGYNADVFGHRPSDAFDGVPDTYWLSVGNDLPDADYAFEYVTAATAGNSINQIRLQTVSLGYTCYISVFENGAWQGGDVIPYNPSAPPAFPNGADIPYVMWTTIGTENMQVINLPRAYNADQVRVTFTNLWDSGLGIYPYRAAVREFHAVYSNVVTSSTTVLEHHTNAGDPGVITEWSTVVKELCGWAGFTWITYFFEGVPADPIVGSMFDIPMRVWGDFEIMGAGPIECTPPEWFLNKTFMEGVNQVKDLLGCIFFVDESGGAVFRLPNIFGGGNFVHDPEATTTRPYLVRQWPIELHENANLLDYKITIDDSQLRSEVLVVGDSPNINQANPVAGGVQLAEADPTYQEIIYGTTELSQVRAIDFTQALGGQTRLMNVPGDATKGFTTVAECQRMAELVGMFILFTYRKGQVTALAHPSLQVDDQVVIYERVTNERNVHYVSGIGTSMNLEAGSYTMQLITHWLGKDPDTDWFVDYTLLTPAVLNLPAILARRQGSTVTTVPPPDPAPPPTTPVTAPIPPDTLTPPGGNLTPPDTPTDLGTDDIRSYIQQTGGQIIVVPNGTYTSGLVTNATHSDWLYLVAETRDQVIVPGLSLQNCSKVVFVGFKFTGSVDMGSNAGTLGEVEPLSCDRLVFWYCDVTNPSGQFGFHPMESDNICILGCRIHNMQHDAIQESSIGTRIEGSRTWGNTDPTGFYHPDAYQIIGSIRTGAGTAGATIKQCVFSVNPNTGGTELDGHFQIGNERSGTPVEVHLMDSWQTHSGNYGFTVDAKFRYADTTLYRTNVKSWGNGFSGNNSTLVANGGNTVDSNYTYGTVPTGTPPDQQWKDANPIDSYESWIATSGL